jgi:hypothetical protein
VRATFRWNASAAFFMSGPCAKSRTRIEIVAKLQLKSFLQIIYHTQTNRHYQHPTLEQRQDGCNSAN